MVDALISSLSFVADTSSAVSTMRDYVGPTIRTLSVLAGIVCAFFIVNSGYLYMTSGGQPEKLDHAKHILRNALIGLLLVLSAATLTAILTHAYGSPHDATSATLPNLQAITPDQASSGLVEVLIKAVTGFLNNIIQTIATPFLAALNFFTEATPLMAENSTVFNLWLTMVGITNLLFVIVLALLGFHVMSAASLGFDEIEFKHLLPRIGLAFLLINTSIFAIDAIIQLSNVLIAAVGKASGAASVWDTLTLVVKGAGGQGLAALLMMLAFLVCSVILLVYYVGRLVTLFIGAVLSPIIVLLWLLPGFRDFSETAIKTYITTIFVLFVHVVILLLSASLFTGMSAASGNDAPNTFMAMVVGLATVIALLKTQSVMMQFSFVSMGARNARKLGQQFMNGVSYMTDKSKNTIKNVQSTAGNAKKVRVVNRTEQRAIRTGQPQTSYMKNKKTGTQISAQAKPVKATKTGTTYKAPDLTGKSSRTRPTNHKDSTL